MLWLMLSRFVHSQSKGSALDSEADSWHSGHGDSSAFLQLGSSSRWFSPAFVPQVPPGSLPPALLTLLVLEAPPWNCGDLVALSLPILLLLECELFFLYFFFKKILFVDNFIYTHSTFSTSFKWHFCTNVTCSERLALSSPWYYNIMLIMVCSRH